MRKFSWVLLSFLLFIACDNSNLTKEQEEINQLSQELESMKAQLEEVTSQVDKTNQELNQINIKLNADVRVEPKPIDNAENANELKPQVIDGQQEKPNDPKPKDEVQEKPAPKPLALDLKDMVLIPPYIIEVNEEDVFNEVGDLIIPARKVKVARVQSFYIDKYEVTVGQFREFLKKSGYKPNPPIDWNAVFGVSPKDNYPMVYISANQSEAYAKWAGKRLPSKEEWEIAGLGGTRPQKGQSYFPWGKYEGGLESEKKAREFANWEGIGGNDKWFRTAPVGSFKPNAYGLYDISGNVFELTLGNINPPYIYRGGGYKIKENRNNKRLWGGDGALGDLVVFWGFGVVQKSRTTSESGDMMGFRCVADIR